MSKTLEDMEELDLSSYSSERATFKAIEPSEWACYLYGSKQSDPYRTIYCPKKGQEPNKFIRYMMKICLGCTWVKERL